MKHEEISLNTKKKLAEALKTAMRKKPFEKITVSELIKYAAVNRKTFYYHFRDIYDLLKWMLEEEAINVVKHYDLLGDYEEAIDFVMDYIEENDYIITSVNDSIGQEVLKSIFHTDLHDIVNSFIEKAEQIRKQQLDPSYKEFLTQFYIEALAGMLVNWVKNRDEKEREKVKVYLRDTIRNSLKGILEEDTPAAGL